jgi:hypothetical protein
VPHEEIAMIERAVRQSLLGAVLFLATGCTSFEIFDSTAHKGFEPSKVSKVVTYHGSYWGIKWSETDHIPCGENCQGFHKVASYSNLGYDIAPIVTLGLWAPSTVEYWCYVKVEDDPYENTALPPEGGGPDGKDQ